MSQHDMDNITGQLEIDKSDTLLENRMTGFSRQINGCVCIFMCGYTVVIFGTSLHNKVISKCYHIIMIMTNLGA